MSEDDIAGIPVIAHADIGSTNVDAMARGVAGDAAPLWVTAERQTSGRGRDGRTFISERGNLFASLLIRPKCSPQALSQLSFVAAVALIAAIRAVAGDGDLDLQLKWPNDVMLSGAKLSGILTESTLLSPSDIVAVIGIGVNLAHAPDLPGRVTTFLAAHGIAIAPRDMLTALSRELLGMLAVWDDGYGFAAIRARWLADATPVGTPMSVHAANRRVEGTFAGVDATGALILRDQSGYHHILSFGDVTLGAAVPGQG